MCARWDEKALQAIQKYIQIHIHKHTHTHTHTQTNTQSYTQKLLFQKGGQGIIAIK